MTFEELEQRRAERKDPLDLPHTMTQREVNDYAAATAALDSLLLAAKNAQATLAQLPALDAVQAWLDHLNAWRATLCDELLALPQRIRDPKLLGVQRNVTLSIRCIDFGLGVIKDTGYDLTSLRLGQLMLAAGYEIVGADTLRNFSGELPWLGSLPEVEHRIEDIRRRRAQAQAALDDALLDDEVRAAREAEAAELRDAYNKMRVKVGPADGPACLVAYRPDGEVFEKSEMAPLQRKAFEAADAAFRATQRRGEPIASR